MSKARQVTRSYDGIVVKYRSDRGKWVGRIWMPDASRPGKGRYTSQLFPNAVEAEEWAKREKAKLLTDQETSGSGKVADLAKTYHSFVKLQGAGQGHTDHIKRVLGYFISQGAINLRDPSFEVKVLRIINEHQAKRKGQLTPSPASESTKRKMLVIAKGFSKWAVERRHIGFNPLAGTRLGRATRTAKKTWTLDELRTLISEDARWNLARNWNHTQDALHRSNGDKNTAAAALGVHIATIYNRLAAGQPSEDPLWLAAVLGLYTGARPSEVRAMTWDMIDWDHGNIVLPANAPGNKIRTERPIRMMEELKSILKPRAKVGATTIVDHSVANMDQGVYSSAFQRYCVRVGVTELGPHTLRHCCGSLMTAMGMQPVMVLLQLGHDNPTVSKRYAESASKYARDVKAWTDGEFRIRTIPPAKTHTPAKEANR